MGAHLKYRIRPADDASKANEFIAKQPEADILDQLSRLPKFISNQDITEYEEETGAEWPDFFDSHGEGQIKPSSPCLTEKSIAPIFQYWASIFAKLHEKFTVEVYSGSCALQGSNYFTPGQTDRITNGGEALTGDNTEEIREYINEPSPHTDLVDLDDPLKEVYTVVTDETHSRGVVEDILDAVDVKIYGEGGASFLNGRYSVFFVNKALPEDIQNMDQIKILPPFEVWQKDPNTQVHITEGAVSDPSAQHDFDELPPVEAAAQLRQDDEWEQIESVGTKPLINTIKA